MQKGKIYKFFGGAYLMILSDSTRGVRGGWEVMRINQIGKNKN